MNKMTRTDYLLLLLIVLVMMFTALSTPAQADEWGTRDKHMHKVASGIATVGFYPVLRYAEVEHAAEWSAASVIAFGAFKEVALDLRGIGNRVPSKPSGKDAVANVIGAAVGYVMLKGGEMIEDEYGWNPFYWEW